MNRLLIVVILIIDTLPLYGQGLLALLAATLDVDPNSKDGQEIVSIFDKLDSSCGN